MEALPQIVLLLGLAVAVVVALQRFNVPSTVGYLLVGVILGPGTIGPVVDAAYIDTVAEFGIVFLLFTIGLSYSLPELRSMRRLLPVLGTGQVVLTTALVTLGAWLIGLPVAAAFVIGAVFAQSSTTIIGKQLAEQGEENTRSGRLGLAMSVFQDVTAVPFVVVIPALAAASGVSTLGPELILATAKAALAIALVFVLGRRLLHPLFRVVARRGSTETFTLTVLFVVLVAAMTTNSLGLSLAFGAFLAGMTLGETEFRHAAETTIRPFRDVLLGLFFVAIGMQFQPSALPDIWAWALLGAVVLVVTKALLVTILVAASGQERAVAARTGLLLAVGGEFGLALLSIALTGGVIGEQLGQIGLASVLLSMIVGTFLIRKNRAIGNAVSRRSTAAAEADGTTQLLPTDLQGHVVICGYGRIGQGVAHLLEQEALPYVAVDLDADRVRAARHVGEPVYYGDAGDPSLIEAVGLNRASLVVIAHDDIPSALVLLGHVQRTRPELPVVVRTRDEAHTAELRAAGAAEVVPETLEAGLAIASHVLLLLDVPAARVESHVRQQRSGQYTLMREFFHGSEPTGAPVGASRAVRTVVVPVDGVMVGRPIESLEGVDVAVSALKRGPHRVVVAPVSGHRIEEGDVVVLVGSEEALSEAERALLRTAR
ncbi:cation:proton antiporter [Georgenia sp. M64]|uniref:cation:proton antiporter n=1 Tax=Georgenia sp. M64 TaxID=3120520 RepID=UPI0030E287C4